jgi:hypothetical protein
MTFADSYASIADSIPDVPIPSRNRGVAEWAEDRLVADPEADTPVLAAYEDYLAWAEEHGFDPARNPSVVGRYMTSIGVKRSSTGGDWNAFRSGARKVTLYLGVRLK